MHACLWLVEDRDITFNHSVTFLMFQVTLCAKSGSKTMTDEIEDMDVDKSDIPKMVSFHHILWRVCRRTVLFSIDTQCENIDENLQHFIITLIASSLYIFFAFTSLFVVFYVFASVYVHDSFIDCRLELFSFYYRRPALFTSQVKWRKSIYMFLKSYLVVCALTLFWRSGLIYQVN